MDQINFVFQPTLFNVDEYELDKEEKTISPEESRRLSDEARRALEMKIRHYAAPAGDADSDDTDEKEEKVSWFGIYLELCNGGYPWRLAAYIAWASSPRIGRWPETQDQLATQVLGLTSDRQIAKWRHRDGENIMKMIANLQVAPMLEHRADVFRALVKSASNADYKNHADREMFLEMTGDYIPTSKLIAHLKRAVLPGAEGKSTADLERDAGYDDELSDVAGSTSSE